MVLNADANWNRENLQTKKKIIFIIIWQKAYIAYQTPLNSEYDTETWKSGKEVTYIELLPIDGIEQTPQKKEQTKIIQQELNLYIIKQTTQIYFGQNLNKARTATFSRIEESPKENTIKKITVTYR